MDNLISYFITAGILGFMFWVFRTWINKVNSELKNLGGKIDNNYKEIVRDYALKSKCEDREDWIVENEKRLEEVERFVSYTKGVKNGKSEKG